jgi:hypothetical protein
MRLFDKRREDDGEDIDAPLTVAELRAAEGATRFAAVVRYCQGDSEAAARDGLHEILSDMGL